MLSRIILLLVFLVALGCSQNLTITWNAGDDADRDSVTHYIVYAWEGDSTQYAVWSEALMDSVGVLPHTINFFGTYQFAHPFQEDLIIIAGCRSESVLGRRSGMALSSFYFPPNRPEYVAIKK